jgi:hypothetical protein
MNHTKYILLILLFIVAVYTYSLDRILNVSDVLTETGLNFEDTALEKFDSNNDGEVDYLIRTGRDGAKIMESIDFNHDGNMDDLYFYTDGIIIRREVDSNFDMNIDIWVYIKDGNLIEKYEQDLDFDGNIDKVKTFGG